VVLFRELHLHSGLYLRFNNLRVTLSVAVAISIELVPPQQQVSSSLLGLNNVQDWTSALSDIGFRGSPRGSRKKPNRFEAGHVAHIRPTGRQQTAVFRCRHAALDWYS